MAIKRTWKPSPNYSGRGGSGVRLITLHTTEGATTNQSLANFICQASAQVSYHISVDNQSDGVCFEYVKRPNKAWAQASYNPMAITGVFCTPSGASANWSRDYWLNNQKRAMQNMAQWVAEESKYWGIPLTALSNSQAQGSGRGVCQHSNLGAGGSGHYDCGNGFPMDELLRLASGGGSAPIPTGKVRYSDMTAIICNPTVVPMADGAKGVIFSADPGGQGLDSVSVRAALHNNGTAGWEVNNITLTPAAPSKQLSMAGHDVISVIVNTKNAQVGYEWRF